MPDHSLLSPLILLILGLYYCAVGIGGLVAPEQWRAMVREMKASPFEQLMGGAVALLVGALLLIGGLASEDGLGRVIGVLGVVAMAKGLAFLALPGRFLGFTDALLAHRSRLISSVAILIGLVLVVIGATHLF